VPKPPDNVIRRRRLLAVVALGVLLLGAAAAYVLQRPGDVSNPKAAFTTVPPVAKPDPPKTVDWPIYGYDRARTKWFRTRNDLDPPYARQWSYRGKKLLEFPPVLDDSGLYLLDDGGVIRKLSKLTGKKIWGHRLGTLAASSPALDGQGRVFAVTLLQTPNAGHGNVTAMNARSGRILWRRALPSRAESSPLVVGQLLIFGTEDGTVFALNRRTGRTAWTFSASGAVKGGLALSGGRLFFGDYGGEVHAIRLSDGKQVWSAAPGGTFYSTPAVAWGRVYIGNTDGRLYSYTTSGDLAWARQTGAYVYASPAVADLSGIGPTVYAGSYSGTFYAWNARTGDVRWSYEAGGKISGGAFVIGDLVWFDDLGNERTVALGARTGRKVFTMETGAFNPLVTDGQTLFIVGYADMYGFKPRR
jgi:outer membrane protein assembly factor BamB